MKLTESGYYNDLDEVHLLLIYNRSMNALKIFYSSDYSTDPSQESMPLANPILATQYSSDIALALSRARISCIYLLLPNLL